MLLPARHLPIRPARFITTFAIIFVFIWWHSHVLTHSQPAQIADALESAQQQQRSGHASLANATLGFQTIIAISSEDQSSPTAWRQQGLLAAAERTGLHIEIHQSRRISDDELAAFRGRKSPINGERPGIGSARAWIAHLDALRHVFARNISTALILEDDADWDVRIRSQLAPDAGIPRSIRQILQGPGHFDPSAGTSRQDNSTLQYASLPEFEAPFTHDFDVIALGHCAAITTPFATTLNMDEEDKTLLPAQSLRAVHDRYAYTPLPNFTRRVIMSPHPTCTYAYGVTFEGAQKLLERLGNGGGAAFDNEVGGLCWGNGRRKKPKENGTETEERGPELQHDGLRCVAVSPEVIHGQRLVLDGHDDDGDTSLVDAQNRAGWAADSQAHSDTDAQSAGASQGEELRRSDSVDAIDHHGHGYPSNLQKQLDVGPDRYSDPDSHGWRLWGVDVIHGTLQKAHHFFTMNIMYSARCNAQQRTSKWWDARDELVQCLPTDEELDRFTA
ncbi:hypothetical protein IWX90DRAFT_217644 [Phyllosticta citrichinensis]|uniref:Glycosyltransferase family 25 protein n=1 Tax=Phyllosticta citrichinensis TaxID=1130410 RepID=A0ABR1XTK2_9PEZI